jgi:hypothetical protein
MADVVTDHPLSLVPMLQQALAAPKPTPAQWQEILRRMGIDRRPIGAVRLQAELIAAGHDPTSNEFSRDLIARRED